MTTSQHPIVAADGNSAKPHSEPTPQPAAVRHGSFVLIEVLSKQRGRQFTMREFCSDSTRDRHEPWARDTKGPQQRARFWERLMLAASVSVLLGLAATLTSSCGGDDLVLPGSGVIIPTDTESAEPTETPS